MQAIIKWLQKKTSYERDIKDVKIRIKNAALRLKKETPSAVIMIDLAEDEAFNTDNLEEEMSSDAKPKWRVLVDKIIA